MTCSRTGLGVMAVIFAIAAVARDIDYVCVVELAARPANTLPCCAGKLIF